MSVRLGAAGGRSQAELDGLMARVLKNELAAQKYLYTTEWRSIPAQPDRPDGAMMLVLAADELRIRDRRSVPVGRDELAARLDERCKRRKAPGAVWRIAYGHGRRRVANACVVCDWLLSGGGSPGHTR